MEDVVTGDLQKWEAKGTTVKGILLSYEERTTPKGQAHVYEVETKNGITPFFAPSDLHKKLKGVPMGYCVIIEQGDTTRTQSGNDFKNFNVKKGEQNEANLKMVEMFETKGMSDQVSPDATPVAEAPAEEEVDIDTPVEEAPAETPQPAA